MTTRKHPPLTGQARQVIDQDVGWHIRRIARLANAAFDEALAPSGLSAAQFALMALIAANDDDRIGALADRAGMDPSSLSRTLDGMAKQGLVEITVVERDRRRRAVWLTDAGAWALAEAMPLWRAAHDRLDPHFADLALADVGEVMT